jgi:glycosyltransferase involved in cell wall biosynthesis
VTTTTARDAEVFRRDLPSHDFRVIQNGVDPTFLEPMNGIPVELKTMTFTGLMGYWPNVNGILFFLNQVFPLLLQQVPDARVYVVGKDPPPGVQAFASDQVVVTGFVDDVRPYVARAEVFIIPLLIGGGIRSKALEAMALRKPIVSTSVGWEGILLKDGESVLTADTPQEFANCVARLFADKELAKRLGHQGYETVLKHYMWEEKGRQLEEVFQAVTKGQRTND